MGLIQSAKGLKRKSEIPWRGRNSVSGPPSTPDGISNLLAFPIDTIIPSSYNHINQLLEINQFLPSPSYMHLLTCVCTNFRSFSNFPLLSFLNNLNKWSFKQKMANELPHEHRFFVKLRDSIIYNHWVFFEAENSQQLFWSICNKLYWTLLFYS